MTALKACSGLPKMEAGRLSAFFCTWARVEAARWRSQMKKPGCGGSEPGFFRLRAFPLLMESEAELYAFDLTRFLHANRVPLRSKTL
ncbi:MAG: hypothetical protein JSS22_15085 [Proteobacteria bacterium]|nr:hypothetical protein [Pseudomonadota bacterium]